MDIKPSKGIVFVAATLFLLPLILTILASFGFFISSGDGLSLTFKEWISTTWVSFIFFGILGFGIYHLNNKFRIVTVAVAVAMTVGGPLGLIIGSFMVSQEMHAAVIEKYGIWVDVFAWSTVLLLCLPYALIGIFLTRSKVKEQFK